jgi:hypothetical protein
VLAGFFAILCVLVFSPLTRDCLLFLGEIIASRNSSLDGSWAAVMSTAEKMSNAIFWHNVCAK